MNKEMQKVIEALMLIYGSNLQAATITVLLKDGDTAVRWLSYNLPQKEKQDETDRRTNLEMQQHHQLRGG